MGKFDKFVSGTNGADSLGGRLVEQARREVAEDKAAGVRSPVAESILGKGGEQNAGAPNEDHGDADFVTDSDGNSQDVR